MKVVNYSIHLITILLPILLIYILIFGLRNRIDIKRKAFFKSAFKNKKEDDVRIEIQIKLEDSDMIIDAFETPKPVKKSPVYLGPAADYVTFVKSATDVAREKLIAMVISINFILIISNLPELVFLILIF